MPALAVRTWGLAIVPVVFPSLIRQTFNLAKELRRYPCMPARFLILPHGQAEVWRELRTSLSAVTFVPGPLAHLHFWEESGRQGDKGAPWQQPCEAPLQGLVQQIMRP